jgi:hypothetical protein
VFEEQGTNKDKKEFESTTIANEDQEEAKEQDANEDEEEYEVVVLQG